MVGDVDLTGRIVSVDKRRYGSRLTTAASIGATTLYVEQTGDFDEDGGQVLVGGDLYDYTGLDEDAGTIEIDPTLSVTSEVDDPVDIFDPEVGTIVVDYVALVLLDDQDPGDEPIEVAINHALFDYLSEGVRGGAAENVTLTPDGPDDYVISQVDGKEVENIAVDEAVTMAGDAIDAAEESLTAAQLAQAILDGEIDYYYTTSAPWANGSAAHDDDLGDVWVDTDSDPKVAYRWGVPTARTWNVMADGGLVAALFAAQDAQITADGKIKHFVGSSTPTADGYGDIWTNTAQGNKKYYWDGDSWEPLPLGSDGLAYDIVGKSFTTAPVYPGGPVVTLADGGLSWTGSGAAGAAVTWDGQIVSGSWVLVDTDGHALAVLAYSGGSVIYPAVTFSHGASGVFSGTHAGTHTGTWSGVLSMAGNIDLNGNDIVDVDSVGAASVTTTGAITAGTSLNAGGAVNGNTVHADKGLFDDSISTANPAKFNSSGRVVPDTSSARYKTDIQPAAVDTAAMRRVEIVTYLHQDGGGRVELGGIAEQVAAQGLEHLVIRDPEGRPDAIDRAAFAFGVLALAQEQADRLDEQAEQIAALTARLDALEGA